MTRRAGRAPRAPCAVVCLATVVCLCWAVPARAADAGSHFSADLCLLAREPIDACASSPLGDDAHGACCDLLASARRHQCFCRECPGRATAPTAALLQRWRPLVRSCEEAGLDPEGLADALQALDWGADGAAGSTTVILDDGSVGGGDVRRGGGGEVAAAAEEEEEVLEGGELVVVQGEASGGESEEAAFDEDLSFAQGTNFWMRGIDALEDGETDETHPLGTRSGAHALAEISALVHGAGREDLAHALFHAIVGDEREPVQRRPAVLQAAETARGGREAAEEHAARDADAWSAGSFAEGVVAGEESARSALLGKERARSASAERSKPFRHEFGLRHGLAREAEHAPRDSTLEIEVFGPVEQVEKVLEAVFELTGLPRRLGLGQELARMQRAGGYEEGAGWSLRSGTLLGRGEVRAQTATWAVAGGFTCACMLSPAPVSGSDQDSLLRRASFALARLRLALCRFACARARLVTACLGLQAALAVVACLYLLDRLFRHEAQDETGGNAGPRGALAREWVPRGSSSPSVKLQGEAHELSEPLLGRQ